MGLSRHTQVHFIADLIDFCDIEVVFSPLVHIFVSFIKGCFCRRHRQSGKMLGLRLSISLFQEFYKKIASSEFKVDEDLKKERCSPW